MRFLDTNIIVYAFFNQKRKLDELTNSIKERSKEIFNRVDKGENVATSVLNLSEAANILNTCHSAIELAEIMELFYSKENITVFDVTQQDYLNAIYLSKRVGGRINDCLIAYLIKKHNLQELYTFDTDFKNFPWVKIVN